MLRKLFGNATDSKWSLKSEHTYFLSGEFADFLGKIADIFHVSPDFNARPNVSALVETYATTTPASAAVGPAPAAPADAVPTGGKWGPSATFGTTGGTVTWSITGAGWTNQTGQPFFTGSTVELSSFLPSDYLTQITNAFKAWSDAANITFVQVSDGGGNFGVGTSAYIRISGGNIDGA